MGIFQSKQSQATNAIITNTLHWKHIQTLLKECGPLPLPKTSEAVSQFMSSDDFLSYRTNGGIESRQNYLGRMLAVEWAYKEDDVVRAKVRAVGLLEHDGPKPITLEHLMGLMIFFHKLESWGFVSTNNLLLEKFKVMHEDMCAKFASILTTAEVRLELLQLAP